MKLLSHHEQFAIIFALTLLAGVDAQTQPRFVTGENSGQAGTPYVDRQVIVKLDDIVKASAIDAMRSSKNAKVLKRFSSIGAELWQISDETVEAAIARYRQDPRIKYVEPNYRVALIQQRVERFPNDAQFSQMWGLHNTGQTGGTNDADIDAPEAWDIETGNSVVIGVIDTGVDWTHEDLAANIWINPGEIPNNGVDDDGNGYVDDIRGWDFVNNDNDPMDDEGHGSHVSGTIAAVGNNSVGTVGVSWSAKIMALKFLDASGNGTTADAIAAVEYATRMRARLMSNSWGGGGFSQALRDAIAAAGRAGILFVAAAGNDGTDNDRVPHYPSNYDLDNIIAVAATDHNDRLAGFSSFGATTVDLGAPGVNILSTFPRNTYGTISGTSMATPHVSGAISLIWSRVPGLTHLPVKELILQNVDPIPSLQGRTVSGGRLNVFKALQAAEPDSIAPTAVADLATTDPKSNFITLTWTASGDDGDSGKAAAYDIRYSTSPINSANFAAATAVSVSPAPKPAGDSESFAVGGLNFNTTYYFALKVIDEQGNASEVSNSPSGTTLGIPEIAVTPDSLADSLLTGAQSTKTLTITNNGEGTLDFNIAIEGGTVTSASLPFTAVLVQRHNNAGTAKSDLAPDETLAGAIKAFSGAETVRLPFRDDFEDGNFSDWIDDGGPGIKEVTSTTAAAGNFSFHYRYTGSEGHLHGIHQEFEAASRPESVSFYVRSGSTATADGYFVLSANGANVDEAIFFFANDNGFFYVNANVGGDESFPYNALQWYHVEFRNIDWTAKIFDYYIDNALIKPAIPFRNAALVNDFDALYLYNFSFGSQAWWDEIRVGGRSPQNLNWLSAAPISGTVFTGSSLDITVTFNATALNGGDYDGKIVIANNDPQADTLKVPARLHVIGAPDIALSDSVLDFGARIIGDTATAKLTVFNLGTDALTVTNISSDNGDYAAAPDTFTLNSRDSREVLIRFIPNIEGDISGTLTITTNDPDEPAVAVALRGRGVPPPEIAVVPDSLRENLFTGQISKQILTIANTGSSDLFFEIAFENINEPIPLSAALKNKTVAGKTADGKIENSEKPAAATILNGARNRDAGWTLEILRANERVAAAVSAPITETNSGQAATAASFLSADEIWRQRRQNPLSNTAPVYAVVLDGIGTLDPSARMWDELNANWPRFGDQALLIDYSTFHAVEITEAGLAASGADVVIISNNWDPTQAYGPFSEDEAKAIAKYVNEGAGLYISGGTFNNGVYPELQSHVTYLAPLVGLSATERYFWNGGAYGSLNLIVPDHPVLRNISTPFTSGWQFDTHVPSSGAWTTAAIPTGTLIGISDNQQTALVVNGNRVYHSSLPDHATGTESDKQFLYNAIALAGGASWVSATPLTGTVPPNSQVEIEVTFDATGLKGGDYTADLVVANNDPDEKRTIVPVHLQVAGAADIAVKQDTLDFGQVISGAKRTLKFSVQNKGSLDLLIFSAVADPTVYTVSPAYASVDPGEEEVFTVGFAPQFAGDFTGTLTFKNNDPDETEVTATLLGKGVIPPEIAVEPDSLSEHLFTGQIAKKILTIANSGGTALAFDISFENLNEPPIVTLKVRDPEAGLMSQVDSSSVKRSVGAKRLIRLPIESVREQLAQYARLAVSGINLNPAAFTENQSVSALDPKTAERFHTQLQPYRQLAAQLNAVSALPSVAAAGSYSTDMLFFLLSNPDLVREFTFTDVGDDFDLAKIQTFSGLIVAESDFRITLIEAQAVSGFYKMRKPILMGMDDLDDNGQPVQNELFPVFGISGAFDGDFVFGSLNPNNPITKGLTRLESYGSDNDYYQLNGADWIFADAQNRYFGVSYQGTARTALVGEALPAVWSGGTNNAMLIANAINWIMIGGSAGWVSVDTTSGLVPPGSQAELEVIFNATGLRDGDYTADFVVTSDDPDEKRTIVPLHLQVAGAADIAAAQDTMDFGKVFIGAKKSLKLAVKNTGALDLLIFSAVTDPAVYTVSPAFAGIDPGGQEVFTVRFSPQVAADYPGTLTFTSNDPDEQALVVTLSGKGVPPPNIAVRPDSLRADLFTGADTTQILTISNSSGSVLIWQATPAFASSSTVVSTSPAFHSRGATASEKIVATLPPVTPAPQDIFVFDSRQDSFEPHRISTRPQASTRLEEVLKNLNQDFAAVTGVIPNRFDFSEGEFGISINDGGNDMYDNGNFLSTNLGSPLDYSDNIIVNSPILGGRYFTRKYPGLFVLVADMEGVNAFEISGGLGADGSGNVDGAILEMVLFGTTYQGFVKRVYNASDPSVNHLIIIANNPAASHEFSTDTNDDFHRVFNLSGTTRLYYLLYAGDQGFYIDNTATLNIMNAFLQVLDLIPQWLTVTPDSGRVAAGSSVEVAVRFDATGLRGGDYKADLLISSNDPDEDRLKVPAHLRVTGAPVIAVSDTLLQYGEVFVGVTAIDTLIVSNRGTDSLKVSSIAADNTDYSVSPASFTLAPGESRAVEVSFTPSAASQRNGALSIVSNDKVTPQLQVALAGEGVEPPVISVTPAAFEFRMNAGDSATAVMTIANTGGSPLNFKIRDEEAPQTTAASDQKLYWTELLEFPMPDTLHRSNLDGTQIDGIFTGIDSDLGGIAVDDQSGRIYWIDFGERNIRSSKLDGSDVKILVSGLVDPNDIDLDPAGGKMYWNNFSAGTISRANLDGSDVSIIVTAQRAGAGSGTVLASGKKARLGRVEEMRPEENATVLNSPWGIALDLTHGKIYWTELYGNRIGRANLDGSGVETVISSGADYPLGIKLDVVAGKIYFVDGFNQAIKRANLDGSQIETIIPFAGSNPLDIELDIEARQFYWTDYFDSQISRANFDGSDVQVVVKSDRANNPFGIALSLGTGWLNEAPSSGTIAAGSSQDIEIKVDAGALATGNSNANVLVESNDPQNKVVTVPVKLQVTAGDLLIAIADTLHGVPNETVDVPVYLTLNEDSLAVVALGATVKATNKVLTFVDFTPGSIIPDTSLRVISPTPDSVRLAFLAANGQNLTQSGLLATLRFQIANNAPVGQTALLNFSQLMAADSSAKTLSFSADNGRLKVNKAPVLSGRVQYAGTGAAKPAANLAAKLTQNGALVQATKTDAGGNYVLANIIPGANYRVQLGRASGGIGAAITPSDALMALRASLSGAQKLAADVDGNLAVEPRDATMIFDFFLGLISQFPVEAWRTFPASYNLDATPDAWKTAPDGIDYPSLRSDLTNQDYRAVVRGDVDLDWPPAAATSSQPLARLAASSAGNSEALLQVTATNAVIVSGAKAMAWQVRLDGAALQKGVYAFGVELRYDASALEITQVRWGKVVPVEGLQLKYQVFPAAPQTDAENSEAETLTGRLRFGGFSTTSAAIREAGALIEIEAQLRVELAAGISLPIRISEVSAAVGASPGLSKSNGAGDFTNTTIAVADGAVQVVAIPTDFALQPNYPNPFNPATRIQYQLPEAAVVKLEIFNALGQKVRTLVNGEQQPAGYYKLEWNGRNDAEITVPSGIYFYRFEAKGAAKTFAKTRKMLMVK